MDEEAVQACRIYAIQLKSLSGERIQSEMRKIIHSTKAAEVLELMVEHQITKEIFPDAINVALLKQLIQLQGEYDTVSLDSCVKIAALIAGGDKAPREAALRLATDWKLSNRDGVLVLQYAAPNRKIDASTSLKEQKQLLRKLPRDVYLNLLFIAWAKSRLDGNGSDATYQDIVALANEWQVPKFPITGLDLLQIGIPKGKIFGRILRAAEEWWEEHDYQPPTAFLGNQMVRCHHGPILSRNWLRSLSLSTQTRTRSLPPIGTGRGRAHDEDSTSGRRIAACQRTQIPFSG